MPSRLLLLLLLVAAPLRPALAESSENLDYPVKAAMMYNFTRFIEWPPAAWKSSQDPLVIGVLGVGPASQIIEDTLRGKSYAGREIHVTHLHSISGIPQCQMLFVTTSEKKHLPDILRAAQAVGVLTVSDIAGFVDKGGMIGFFLEDKRLRFEIAPTALGQVGITASSKLLNLAAVKGGN